MELSLRCCGSGGSSPARLDSETGRLVESEKLPEREPLLADGVSKAWLFMAAMYLVPSVAWVGDVIYMYLVDGIHDPAEKWHFNLPGLGETVPRAVCMGLHFLCGSVITLLGVWQVLPVSTTPAWRSVHRVTGRIYVLCSLFCAVGGFGFIFQQWVMAGGWPMTLSFSIYGLIVVSFAVLAYWTARNKDFAAHRRWAIRSFSMGIASFLYRVFLLLGVKLRLSHQDATSDDPLPDGTTRFFRDDPYNQVIVWGYFVWTLMFVEWYLRAPPTRLHEVVLHLFFFVAVAALVAHTYFSIQELMAS